MATREIKICDICKSEVNNLEMPWHSKTTRCVVVAPDDGINGGNFTGDWCAGCRIRLNNFIETLKSREEQT